MTLFSLLFIVFIGWLLFRHFSKKGGLLENTGKREYFPLTIVTIIGIVILLVVIIGWDKNPPESTPDATVSCAGVNCPACRYCVAGSCVARPDGSNDCGSGCQRCINGSCQDYNEVFAKEIGFRGFQQANKNFEYRIIFDASLQKRQQELYGKIRGLEK